MNKFAIVLFALAAATTRPTLSANAQVQTVVVPDDVPYRAIHTNGLDLTSPAVVRKLRTRVRWAADSVCPKNLELDDMVPTPERRHCLDNAISSGFVQIETKHLAAIAQRKSAGAPSVDQNGH